MMRKQKMTLRTSCFFCINNMLEIDHNEAEILRRFTSLAGKIMPRPRSGACAWHQRKLAQAIKRARNAALLPFTNK